MTVAGTLATAGLSLLKVTTVPPAGAREFRATRLNNDDTPPAIVGSESVRVEITSGNTVIESVRVSPLKVAVNVTGVASATSDVVMLNDGEIVAPAAIVTEAGTAAAEGLLLVNCTTLPPAGALPEMLMLFPVIVPGPTIDVGPTFRLCSAGGFTVNDIGLLTPLKVAVMVTTVGVATAVVAIAKYLMVCPAATVTVSGGSATAGLSLLNATVTPAAAAAAFKMIRLSGIDVPPVHDPVERTSVCTSGFTTRVSVLLTPS